jgi:hypothetical protein
MLKKDTNEMKVLREFVKEFSPFFNDIDHNGKEITDTMTYTELVNEVKEIAKEL